MICGWVQGIEVAGHVLDCAASGLAPMLAGGVAVAVGLATVIWLVVARPSLWGTVCGGLAIPAALLLGAAAGLPEARRIGDAPPGGRLVILMDNSESVRREGIATLEAARRGAADRLQAALDDAPDLVGWSAEVWQFGATVQQLTRAVPVQDAVAALRGVALDAAAPAAQTDIDAALSAALRWIGQGPGAGAVWLVTDGHATSGRLEAALDRAVAAGVSIHTYPVGSTRPLAGLLAHDLGPDQAIGRPAVLRGTVLGGGVLDWGINGRSQGAVPVAPAVAPRALRLTADFEERGLNFMSLRFTPEASRTAAWEETLFALVRGPARVLVYGDAAWVDAAPADDFVILRAAPGDPVDPAGFDAVVIDAQEPGDFPAGFSDRMLAAAGQGTGLFIVNGPLRGSIEDKQRMSDWEQTPLGDIIPVNSDPQVYLTDPPKRDVMIVIDNSRSMSGDPAILAVQTAHALIDQLRPEDSITIVPFADQARATFARDTSAGSTVRDAKAFVSGLPIGGGTNVAAAVAAAAALTGNYCYLFFIGDGDAYNQKIRQQPICSITTIGVAGIVLPNFDVPDGQEITLAPGQRMGKIEFEVFKPVPRDFFWREGGFQLRQPQVDADYGPRMAVDGNALSYVREESEIVAIRLETPPDPMLVFSPAELRPLAVGVFMGPIPAQWARAPGGPAAVEDILTRLVAWKDPDRFDIALALDGDRLTTTITALGDAPPPATMAGTIRLPDGTAVGLGLERGTVAGQFVGRSRLPGIRQAQRGVFLLDNADRGRETIPIQIPATTTAAPKTDKLSEIMSFGTDHGVLEQIRLLTGGLDLSRGTPRIGQQGATPPARAVWPWLIALGAMLFAASLYHRGTRL